MKDEIKYSRFEERVGAYLIDLILIGGIYYALNYLNFNEYKSYLFYLLYSIPAILYKPILESKYGATLGKMLLKLKVVDKSYNRINLNVSFIRSLITIIPPIIYIPVYYFAFNNPEILNGDSLILFSVKVSLEYPLISTINSVFSFLILTDIIILIANTNKRESLKDYLANTYVIKE